MRLRLCGINWHQKSSSFWHPRSQSESQMWDKTFYHLNLFKLFLQPPPVIETFDDDKVVDSDKDHKRDRDVSFSMAALPIPLGPLGGLQSLAGEIFDYMKLHLQSTRREHSNRNRFKLEVRLLSVHFLWIITKAH